MHTINSILKANLITNTIVTMFLFSFLSSGQATTDLKPDSTELKGKKCGSLRIQPPTFYRGKQLKGPRSELGIMKIVMMNMVELRDIYNQKVIKNPDLKGSIKVKIKIYKNGECKCIVRASTTNDTKFDSAIRDKISQWRFDPCDNNCRTTVIGYTFAFSKCEGK